MEAVGEIYFHGKGITVYDSVEEPWFRAVEIGRLIDYSIGNIGQMVDMVDEGDKQIDKMYRFGNKPLDCKGFRGRDPWFVNEDGLYEILMQSRKPIAKSFKLVVKDELRKMRREGRGFGSESFERRAVYLEHQDELAYNKWFNEDIGDWDDEYWGWHRRGCPALTMTRDGDIYEEGKE